MWRCLKVVEQVLDERGWTVVFLTNKLRAAVAQRRDAGLSIRGCGFEFHPRQILISFVRSLSGFTQPIR